MKKGWLDKQLKQAAAVVQSLPEWMKGNHIKGIRKSLLGFAEDEGFHAAIRKAEGWRDVLEEMMEVCSAEERMDCEIPLLKVRMAINDLVNEAARVADLPT